MFSLLFSSSCYKCSFALIQFRFGKKHHNILLFVHILGIVLGIVSTCCKWDCSVLWHSKLHIVKCFRTAQTWLNHLNGLNFQNLTCSTSSGQNYNDLCHKTPAVIVPLSWTAPSCGLKLVLKIYEWTCA